jgi:ureidoacrylate peracid hydrolase
VIDPQHDFCSEKGALAQRFGFDMKAIQEAVPRLNSLIEEARASNMLVVWVREVFKDDKMRENQKALWGSGDEIWLIREGSPGIEWYAGMISPSVGEPVITKWQYDAFEDTDLHLLLQSRGIDTLLMTGFTTNVCVETTARHGYIKGYHVLLVTDCCSAPTAQEHESGIFNIGTYFGRLTTSSDLSATWAGPASGASVPVQAGVGEQSTAGR